MARAEREAASGREMKRDGERLLRDAHAVPECPQDLARCLEHRPHHAAPQFLELLDK